MCRIEEIEDGHSKEFHLPGNDDFTLCLVRQCADVYAYCNSCPHTGGPLNWAEDNFLTVDGEMIQCATHGALFRITDGLCVWGPCLHKKLTPVPVAVRDGKIILARVNKASNPR